MFCEIIVYHKGRIDGTKLGGILRDAGCGNPIAIADAYTRSSVYDSDPYNPSIFAHDSGQHCFAILQKTNGDQSTFHFEGDLHTSASTLLESVEDYARTIHASLKKAGKDYRVSRLVMRPFEDNFDESGFEGTLVTPRQALKGVNLFHELGTKATALVTALVLALLGLSTEKIRAAELTFVIAIIFTLAEIWRAWSERLVKSAGSVAEEF